MFTPLDLAMPVPEEDDQLQEVPGYDWENQTRFPEKTFAAKAFATFEDSDQG